MRRVLQSTGICGLLCLLAGGLPSFAKADNYVLLIGVGKYEQRAIPSLLFDVNDVHGFGAAFIKNVGYSRDHVIVMTTELKPEDPNYPSKRNFLKKLISLQNMKAEDTIFVYFSGHGVVSKQVEYLLFADADMELLADSALSLKRMHEELDKLKMRQKVIILDACRNDSSPPADPATAKAFNLLLDESAEKGLTAEATRMSGGNNPTNSIYEFIFACKAGQKAQIFRDGTQNSVFSYYLTQGLRGKALKGGGKRLTLNDLYEYAQANVEMWAQKNDVKQGTLKIGAEDKPVTISDNLHAILPAKAGVEGIGT